MKNQIKLFLIIAFISSFIIAQNETEFNFYKEIKVNVTNPSNIERSDELVYLNINELKTADTKFNKDAYIVYLGDKEIPSQLYNDGFECSIILTCNFKPNETQTFSVKYLENGTLRRDYKSRTYAELAMKFDAVYKNKKFTSDHFENFTKVVVPKIHTDHDALFKYEGPGWESEKVGYRFYLDWRNSNDIFGKTKSGLVLHKVGTHDVIAQDDSYHSMLDWGMDIFKVGNSLGIGSIGMMKDNKIEMVAKTDQNICKINYNGPIISEVKTDYKGWSVNDNKYDLTSKLLISAGSRVTRENLAVYGDADNIVTGLVKHPDTEFLVSNTSGDWQYIALYGKQTLNDDNLGIVLFYKKSQLLKQGEDEVNYFVELKPDNRKVEYAFSAAWEKEPDGIKNIEEFNTYINNEITKFNNPMKIEIKQEI